MVFVINSGHLPMAVNNLRGITERTVFLFDDSGIGDIAMVVSGNTGKRDGYHLRRAAIKYNIPYTTTLAGAIAMAKAISAMRQKDLSVKSLQEY